MTTVAWDDVTTTAAPTVRRKPAPETWGVAVSITVHLVLGVAIIGARVETPAPPEEAPIEMVLVAPEPALPPAQAVTVPPPPQAVEPPAAVAEPPPVEATPVEPPPPPVVAEVPEEIVPPPKPKVVRPAEPKPVSPKPVSPKPAPQTPAVAKPATAPTPAPAPANPSASTSVAPRPAQPPGIPSDYVQGVRSRISRYAIDRYPRAAQLKGQGGRVGYTLTLAPDGTLLSFEIVPSGVDTLDKAASEALRNAGPYPKLPDLGAASYKLTGAIVYKLN